MALPTQMRVVITGAGSGLGRAFAEVLADRGASLVLSDINQERLDQTSARCTSRGARAVTTMLADVAKIEEVEALAKRAEDEFGGTDLVINNAGVAVGGKFNDISLEDWKWIMDINLWGVIYGCHVFGPRFQHQGGGAIINVASAAGLLSPPGMSPYSVTKTAVVALSESIYAEMRELGISVTVLCPTFFPTNIAKDSRSLDKQGQVVAQKLMEKSKLTAHDVANFALDACDRGELYALPMADGRWMWRVKRALPHSFNKLAGVLTKLGRRRR